MSGFLSAEPTRSTRRRDVGRTFARQVAAAAAGAACLCAATAAFAQHAAGSTAWPAPEVRVETGALAGIAAGGVENFFGVPYAAPPVDDLRWRAPRPAADWNGTRDASTYGTACPQGESIGLVRTDEEDCLFLNLQRPEGAGAGDNLPVLVMIHGGSWETGSGNNENLNAIVREGGVIGVTMNYRLGLFGQLSHPALAEGGEVGNYGLRDQLAAVEWVHRNIAAFGGDPDRITLGGQSAGGGSICSLMEAPSAKGLFRQAIPMSTVCAAVPREEAIATGETIASGLGCAGDAAAACLRNLPAGTLVDAHRVISLPVDGTGFLPRSGWDAMEAGELAAMPVLIGATRHEGTSFLVDTNDRTVRPIDRDAYDAYLHANFGTDAEAVRAVYPWPEAPTTYSGSYLVAELMMADLLGMGPGGLSACRTSAFSDLLAADREVWAYEFAPDAGPGWFEVPGYAWGTGHAADLIYLVPDRGGFASKGSVLSAPNRDLSDTMIAYWANFVRGGDPNGAGLPVWSPYAATTGPAMQLREGGRSAGIPAAALRASHNCDFWDAMALAP